MRDTQMNYGRLAISVMVINLKIIIDFNISTFVLPISGSLF